MNELNNDFDMNIFTHVTKKVCMCSFTAIFLILIFVISPFSYFAKTSAFIKIIIVILLFYAIYLNILQTTSLTRANLVSKSDEVVTQFGMNIMCSHVFTFFLILLTFFVIKSFF